MSVKTKQCRRCRTSHLGRTYNDHAKKCRCLCNHSPTSSEAGDKMYEDNFSSHPLRCLRVNDYKGNGISGVGHSLYILFKCDARHCLHCLVLTDTNLYKFTKGKTYLVNQRWRHTTCLQHPCYDIGCYQCIVLSASRYQSRSSMYIRGLIRRNWPKQFRFREGKEPRILFSYKENLQS